MITVAVPAFGTLFSWNTVDLAEIKSIAGPAETMSPIDTTHHVSPSAYREFVAGLRDGGDITIEGNFIRTNTTGQIAMHTDFQAGTRRPWMIKMPGWVAGSRQISGEGFVTAFSLSYPHDAELSFSATIKVTGRPVLAA